MKIINIICAVALLNTQASFAPQRRGNEMPLIRQTSALRDELFKGPDCLLQNKTYKEELNKLIKKDDKKFDILQANIYNALEKEHCKFLIYNTITTLALVGSIINIQQTLFATNSFLKIEFPENFNRLLQTSLLACWIFSGICIFYQINSAYPPTGNERAAFHRASQVIAAYSLEDSQDTWKKKIKLAYKKPIKRDNYEEIIEAIQTEFEKD